MSTNSTVMKSHQAAEVVFLNMPFGFLFRPSLNLSLLKAALVKQNVSAKILYKTLRFAELIGTIPYVRMANEDPKNFTLVGEWLFSDALFDSESLNTNGFLNNVLRKAYSEEFVQEVLYAKQKVEPFLNECLQEVLNYHPKVVSFSSMAEQISRQQVASLALARRIKEEAPETIVVFGGANWEAVMAIEALRQFPFIDAIIAGEEDLVFPQLVQRALQKANFSDLLGVYTHQETEKTSVQNATPVRNMDMLPIPDYDDYFEQLKASQLDQYDQPRILFETSRGCWWGEKSHCIFCGLNGANMIYRSKSPNRALAELIHLTQKYPGFPVSASDWILDMKYFKDFIPELAKRNLNLDLFYEVKANLKKEQIRMLRDAGVKKMQAGIESFSDDVLKLVRKGVKGLQNIQLLKWCKELGVELSWLMLWGFPGEPCAEYLRMAKLVPLLTHLAPPGYAGPAHMDRFSPNYDNAEKMGFTNVEPSPPYRYIYPFPDDVLMNLVSFFTFDYPGSRDVPIYTSPLEQQMKIWGEVYEVSDLFSVDKKTYLLIWDLRPAARQLLTVLSGIQKELYEVCDSIQTLSQLQQLIEQFTESEVAHSVQDLLQPLIDLGLLIRDGDSYLNLAIPIGEYSPSERVLKRFYELVDNLPKGSEDEVIIAKKNQFGTAA